MRLALFCLLCALTPNLFAAAVPADLAAVVDPSCRQDLSDPNDLGYRNTSNSLEYANLCIDQKRFRPILNLTTQGEVMVFDNYIHNGKAWHAEIPVTQVGLVYFQILRFPILNIVQAAHTELRFIFKPGFTAKLSRADGETAESGDIVVSYEAGFPVDVSYDFMKGMVPNYPRVAKIMSSQEKLDENPGRDLEQYDLALVPEDKNILLVNALNHSAKMGMAEFYSTIRPNCTTEAFDLIDGVPSLKGRFPPFMTVASVIDPIAGPSIKALQKRGILISRVQNFSDEVKGIKQTLPTPEIPDSFTAPFLPEVHNREWSLAIVLPDQTAMSVSEKASLETLRGQLVLMIPSLVQSYGAVMLQSPEEQNGQGVFLRTMKVVVEQIPAVLKKINAQLPEKATPIRMYFAPDVKGVDQFPTSLGNVGLPVELPFAVHEYQLGPQLKSEGDVLYGLSQGFAAAAVAGADRSLPAFLIGAAILVNAQKDHAKVTTQIAAGLYPMTSKMSSDSPQVVIDQLVIPQTRKGESFPTMIITQEQDALEQTANPIVDIKFGPFMYLGNEKSEYGLGSFNPNSFTPFSIPFLGGACSEMAPYMPRFEGRFKNPLTGNGVVDFLTHMNFNVTGLTMDLQTKSVQHMDLSIDAFTMACMDNQDAETQFTNEANKAIQDMINKASEDPILQKLSPLLN